VCKPSKKRCSAENALTVTMPSNISAKSEKMGDLVLDSMRLRSLPVLRYPMAISRYRRPRMNAGNKKYGNTTLQLHKVLVTAKKTDSWPSARNDNNSCDEGS